MAELIALVGLTASVLTLVDGASKALEFATAVRKAPDEIASLQGELASFKTAVQNIAAFRGDRELLNSIVESELSMSKDIIEKLHTFIDTSLLRKGLPNHWRWAKKLGRMKQLRENLRIRRNQLVLGLIVLNSYVGRFYKWTSLMNEQGVLVHGGCTIGQHHPPTFCWSKLSEDNRTVTSTNLLSE
jgi:antitoxin component HigA of HigAB toxin-antitoxin module